MPKILLLSLAVLMESLIVGWSASRCYAAVVTSVISSFAGDTCRIEIDYDNLTNDVLKLRAVHAGGGSRNCAARIENVVSLQNDSVTATPGTTAEKALPVGLSLSTDEDGLTLGSLRLGGKWE